MPHLFVFVPCERVIINQEDSAISLIELLQDITVPLPAGTDIPPDAIAPLRWYVYTQWHQVPEDDGKHYEQRTQVVLPDGKVPVEAITTFNMTDRIMRNIVTVAGFPISQPGEYRIKIALRESREDTEWKEVAQFPLTVIHKTN